MYVRIRAHFYLICVITSLLPITGCKKGTDSAAAPPSLVFDTSICLGPASQPGAPITSCRQQLSARSDDTVTTGCFILETDEQRTVVPTLWIDDRVEIVAGRDSLTLGGSNQLTVSFFGFTSSDGAAQCSSVTATSGCSGLSDCLIKLGPQAKQAVPGQAMVFDFKESPAGCLMETSPEVNGQSEACDGYDNDCDGRFDEDATFVGNVCPFDVTETCTRTGTEVCEDGILTCRIEEQQDLCNQVDDDCDGTVDEDEACPDCNVDSDCPNDLYCRDRSCVECLDNSQCPMSQPVCTDNQCRPCSNSGQCPDGLVCDVSGGRCGVCSTTTNENPCEMGLICNPSTLTCSSCGADGVSCPNGGLCVNDVCAECDPNDASTRTCGVGLICADDRDRNLGYRCRQCDPNANQNECPASNVCVSSLDSSQNTCEECNPQAPVGNNGCIAAAPICVTEETSGSIECVGCNDGTDPNQPPRQCGLGATCTDGRCEGCRPPSNMDTPSSCPRESPICALNGSAFNCEACTRNDQCIAEFFGNLTRNTCQSGRCVDCNAMGGCDPESALPICNNETCVGCTSNAQCGALNVDGGLSFCVQSGVNAGKCVSCIPGTGQGCGRKRCTDTFQCEGCAVNDFCEQLFPDASVCVGDTCEACDDQADIGENRCPRTTPVCDGNPLACYPCESNNDCEGLQCIEGECVVCSADDYISSAANSSSLEVSAHTGCDPFTPICTGGSCRECSVDADCPVGECTQFGSGVTQNRCRIATEQSCTSRRLGFDAGRQSCTSCVSDDCGPSFPCSTTPQTFDTGDQISKCGGCESDDDCDVDRPTCNEVNEAGEVEDNTIPAWVCRGCYEGSDDCGVNSNGDQTYCSQERKCRLCVDTENGNTIDLGCNTEKPKCVNYQCVN